MAAVLRDLLDSPLASGYRLEVIPTYSGPGRVHRLVVFARAMGALARWCRGDGVRIVHIHTAVRGSIYRKAVCVGVAKLADRPVILHFHAGPGDIDEFAARIGPLRRSLLRSAARRADRVLSVSGAGARRIEAVFGVRDVTVVPNAAPRVDRGESDRDHGPSDRLSLLYMGGFADPAKGGETLVAALPSILASLPDAEVVLAGPGSPPASLERLAAAAGGIRWAGWLDPVAKRRALSTCDVFLLPSISEGLPVALLEAMAYERAIVASEVGGVPDVLADGADALLVPAGDPEALAAASAAAGRDPGLRARLGRSARRRAERLNHDEVFGSIDALYRELAG